MCFLFYLSFFLNEICVWSTEMEISRSTLVESFHCEPSPVIELAYGQPLGAELSVKYIFKKNFFATYDASDRRSYILLSYFARAAFNYPALYAMPLYGEVLPSFTNYVSRIFPRFPAFRLNHHLSLFIVNETPLYISLHTRIHSSWSTVKKFIGLSPRWSWFVGHGNKVTEKRVALRARKKGNRNK